MRSNLNLPSHKYFTHFVLPSSWIIKINKQSRKLFSGNIIWHQRFACGCKFCSCFMFTYEKNNLVLRWQIFVIITKVISVCLLNTWATCVRSDELSRAVVYGAKNWAAPVAVPVWYWTISDAHSVIGCSVHESPNYKAIQAHTEFMRFSLTVKPTLNSTLDGKIW